jgi:Fe-S-cluster containining protein
MALKLKLLPPMKCDKGCGDCCGYAPATEQEYRKVLYVANAKKLTLKHQGQTCPFYQDGTCAVYDARPFACRFFGHVPEMVCSRGYNTNVTPKVQLKLLRAGGKPTRILHEALIEFGIVKTMEEALDPQGGTQVLDETISGLTQMAVALFLESPHAKFELIPESGSFSNHYRILDPSTARWEQHFTTRVTLPQVECRDSYEAERKFYEMLATIPSEYRNWPLLTVGHFPTTPQHYMLALGMILGRTLACFPRSAHMLRPDWLTPRKYEVGGAPYSDPACIIRCAAPTPPTYWDRLGDDLF